MFKLPKKKMLSAIERKEKKFKSKQHFVSSELNDGPFTYVADSVELKCLFQSSGRKKLFVLFSGAINRNKSDYPNFDRWSWGDSFQGSILNIADPTLGLSSGSLSIGWYYGDNEYPAMPVIAGLVKETVDKLGIELEDVVAYGSSAGGYASLMLSSYLDGITAVAINPQTDILLYSKRFVSDFLNISFKKEIDDLSESDRKSLEVVSLVKKTKKSKFLVVQNVLDETHYRKHFKKICEAFGVDFEEEESNSGRLATLLYKDPRGHGPEPRDMVDKILNIACSLNSKDAEVLPAPKLCRDKQQESRKALKISQLYIVDSSKDHLDKDGSITFRPFGRADLKDVKVKIPFDWHQDPFQDRNWRAQLMKWNMLDKVFCAYEKKEDASYLKTCKHVMLDWASNYVHYNTSDPIVWQDFVVGVRAMKIAYLLSQWQEGLLDLNANEVEVFERLCHLHIKTILRDDTIRYSNHTFADFHGVMALAEVVDQKCAGYIRDFVHSRLSILLETQFDSQGVHLEHSFQYQEVGVKSVQRLVNSGLFESKKLELVLQRASSVLNWFYLPDGRLAPIGDTNGTFSTNYKKVANFNGEGVFNKGGYCIVRSDGTKDDIEQPSPSFFVLNGAYHSDVHKQNDQLGILLYEGEDVLIDPGKYAYKSDKFRGYVKSTRAHNTVEINKKNNPVIKSEALGSAIREASVLPWGYVLSAFVKYKSRGIEHGRHCLYNPGNWLLIVDKIYSSELATFTQWHHFSPQLIVNQSEDGFISKLSSGRKFVVKHSSNQKVQKSKHFGEIKPRLQGWVSDGYASMKECTSVGFHTKSKQATMATLLVFQDKKSSLSVNSSESLDVNIFTEKDEFSFRLKVGKVKVNIS